MDGPSLLFLYFLRIPISIIVPSWGQEPSLATSVTALLGENLKASQAQGAIF